MMMPRRVFVFAKKKSVDRRESQHTYHGDGGGEALGSYDSFGCGGDTARGKKTQMNDHVSFVSEDRVDDTDRLASRAIENVRLLLCVVSGFCRTGERRYWCDERRGER